MSDLKLAIEGTIVMSNTLRSLLDAMYDARVPEIWERMSWQSTTLGFWYTELLERDSQFRRWCFMGRPKVKNLIEIFIIGINVKYVVNVLCCYYFINNFRYFG